ncbi:MAG: RES family NAD+ phosphorylase [Mangrovibacterium sp.]
MNVYRITGRKHAGDLSGAGAALYGGRWNKKGIPVLYTGESKEIALLETIVHTTIIPSLDIVTIQIPDDSVSELTLKDLPSNWTRYPAPDILAEIAEKWILSNASLALKVPSCIIHSAHNYILNCKHPDYSKIEIVSRKNFNLDSRLIRQPNDPSIPKGLRTL